MSHLFQRFIVAVGMLLIAVFAFSSTASAAGTWQVVASPNPSPYENHLQAVAAISTNNAYAVGYSVTGINKGSMVKRTLIEEWNGQQWNVVASPNDGTGDNTLNGIVALSANNIYAVGNGGNGLILHYNGTSWSVVSHQPLCGLNAITASSATDIWAVGGVSDVQSKTCTVHFNGSTWTVVASPSPGTSDDALFSVAAVSSTDVYAVGTYCVGTSCDRGSGNFKTLIERFNGSTWSVVSSPNPSTLYNSLNSVAAVSANNIYAVGSNAPLNGGSPGASATLVERFNGTSWSVVASPNVKGYDYLNAIAIVSANNIYAVGAANIPTAPAHPALIEHFNGSSWSIATNPSPGMYNMLNSVARVPGTSHLWTVGTYNNNTPDQTLIEYSN